MKSSKGNRMMIGLMIGLFLCTISGYAHAPREIALSFDRNLGILKAEILHPVKNPEKHYIKRIWVYVNKEMIEEKFYDRQKTGSGHSDEFKLKKVKSGDVITVKAACSRFGGKKTKITVGQQV